MDFDVDAASWAWDFDDAEDNADMDVNLTYRDALRVLGLPDTADPTPAAVRKRYLQLSLETHPDRPGGNAVAFRRAQWAYSYLMKSLERSGPDGGLHGRADHHNAQDAQDAQDAQEEDGRAGPRSKL